MVGPFSPLEPVWTTMAAALAAGAPLASPSAGLLMPFPSSEPPFIFLKSTWFTPLTMWLAVVFAVASMGFLSSRAASMPLLPLQSGAASFLSRIPFSSALIGSTFGPVIGGI